MDVTLNNQQIFPVGTEIGLYPRANWPGSVTQPAGAPLGEPVQTKTVAADGTATFTGLAAGTRYWAHALVGSAHRYVSVTAAPVKETLATLLTRIEEVEDVVDIRVKTVAAAGAAQTISLAEANAYRFTLTAAACTLTLPEPTADGFYIDVKQDATGGRKLVYPASCRFSGGVEPILSTAAGAEDRIYFTPSTDKEHWIVSLGEKALAVGGSSESVAPAVTTALAAQRPTDYITKLAVPVIGRSVLPSSQGVIGAAFRAALHRVVIPIGGTLRDVAVANGETVNGNHRVAILDTGQATAGKYTVLWESGTVAAAGEKIWQVIADPALAVTQGQQLLLAVMNDGTTHKFGTWPSSGLSNLVQLPTNFLPLGNTPKLCMFHNYGSMSFGGVGATLTEAEASVYATTPAVIARIA